MIARAASLLEKQAVSNPVTLLPTNDPKAEGSSKILLTLNSFSQLLVSQTCDQREETWLRAPKCSPHHNKTNCNRSELLLLQQRATPANLQFPVMINPNMLQLIIL